MTMDLLRVESNERVDLEDFKFLANEGLQDQQRQLGGNVLTDPAKTRAWIIDGFVPSCPGGTLVQVTIGRAILSQRVDGVVKYGTITSEGDATKTIDINGYASATYGIYVKFQHVDGGSESRIFWNPAGSGTEYASTIATRHTANWAFRVEAGSPGSEWLKIGEVARGTMTVTDQRDLYFEGSVSGSYASGWSTDGGGVANDRNATRLTYGVKDFQTFSAAMRQCIEDIKGRTLKRWWDRDIGGMNIGFDADPTSGHLAVGDANFYLNLSTNSYLYFDANDALSYVRGSNRYEFIIGGTNYLDVDASAVFPNSGGYDLGKLSTNEWQNVFASVVDVSATGYFGPNTASIGHNLDVGQQFTSGNNTSVGVYALRTTSGANDVKGIYASALGSHTSGTLDLVVSIEGVTGNSGVGGTTTLAVGVRASSVSSVGVITSQRYFEVLEAPAIVATITNNYGLYVDDLTAGVNNYSIYTDGTAPARFGGDVRVAWSEATTRSLEFSSGYGISYTVSTGHMNFDFGGSPYYDVFASYLIHTHATVNNYFSVRNTDSSSYYPAFVVQASRSGPAATQSSDELGRFAFGGYNGSAWVTDSAYITAYATATWSGSDEGSLMEFWLTPFGSNTVSKIAWLGSSGGSAGQLSIKDNYFYLSFNGTDSQIFLDNNDYFWYDRSENEFICSIAGTPEFKIDAAGWYVADTAYATGSLGQASFCHFAGQYTVTAAGGNGTVKMASGTTRDSVGWMKVWLGTTAYYIPFWDTDAGA